LGLETILSSKEQCEKKKNAQETSDDLCLVPSRAERQLKLACGEGRVFIQAALEVKDGRVDQGVWPWAAVAVVLGESNYTVVV